MGNDGGWDEPVFWSSDILRAQGYLFCGCSSQKVLQMAAGTWPGQVATALVLLDKGAAAACEELGCVAVLDVRYWRVVRSLRDSK